MNISHVKKNFISVLFRNNIYCVGSFISHLDCITEIFFFYVKKKSFNYRISNVKKCVDIYFIQKQHL